MYFTNIASEVSREEKKAAKGHFVKYISWVKTTHWNVGFHWAEAQRSLQETISDSDLPENSPAPTLNSKTENKDKEGNPHINVWKEETPNSILKDTKLNHFT